jgi:hypothetical protein
MIPLPCIGLVRRSKPFAFICSFYIMPGFDWQWLSKEPILIFLAAAVVDTVTPNRGVYKRRPMG